MDYSFLAEHGHILVRGLGYTLIVAAATMMLSLACAFPLAILSESGGRLVARAIAVYSWIARATPALAVLFAVYYGLPAIDIFIEPLPAAILGLSLVSTGYNLEFIRAGLRSVPAGQLDATRALGLARWQALWLVILPQAMRVAVPPVFSNLTLMLKGSSLASLVAVSELTGEAIAMIAYTYRSLEILMLVAAVYLTLSSLLMVLQARIERRLEVGLRGDARGGHARDALTANIKS